VVGTRAAAWAPVGGLAAVVVLDEHDEALQQEGAPTWHARHVAIERARRAGVPCVLVSSVPSLDALAWGHLLSMSRAEEREGWPLLEIVDRTRDDPARTSLVTNALMRHLRSESRVVCVLNRRGQARLLACVTCGDLARCERCDAAVEEPEPARFHCRRCGADRPAVCTSCGASRFKRLRPGVARLREELEAAAGEEVAEVTGASDDEVPDRRVYVGTEAVLHRLDRADVVAFLDFDEELLAPRYRATEQALALLARAARLVRGRAAGGRLLVQTGVPRHDVLDAVLHADPSRWSTREAERRRAFGQPPFGAFALVKGPAADGYVAELATCPRVAVGGAERGAYLVRAPDATALADALASVPRRSGVRIAVDPPRV
jgi:primosomal protein N' (replication factor Y)